MLEWRLSAFFLSHILGGRAISLFDEKAILYARPHQPSSAVDWNEWIISGQKICHTAYLSNYAITHILSYYRKNNCAWYAILLGSLASVKYHDSCIKILADQRWVKLFNSSSVFVFCLGFHQASVSGTSKYHYWLCSTPAAKYTLAVECQIWQPLYHAALRVDCSWDHH